MPADYTHTILSDTNFRQEVLEARQIVLVEFGEAWCGACHILAPMLGAVVATFQGAVKLGKLNLDAGLRTAQVYGVREVPTLLFFRNGEVVDHLIGAVPRKILIEKLQALLTAPQSFTKKRSI